MIPTLGIFMSLNDPQWGNRGGNDGDKSGGGDPRRPNDGPPDLEELCTTVHAIELLIARNGLFPGHSSITREPPLGRK